MSIFDTEHRDPARIDPTLEKIGEIWKRSPQLRLGQLLGNCVQSEIKFYYMEDDVLLEKLEAMYREIDKDS